MKDKNKIYIIISIILVSVIIAGGILYVSKLMNPKVVDMSFVDIDFYVPPYGKYLDLEDLEWEVVTNQKYGYGYIVPKNNDFSRFFNINIDKSTSTLGDYAKNISSLGNNVIPERSHLNGKEVYQFILSTTSDMFVPSEKFVDDGYYVSSNEQVNILETDSGIKIIITHPTNSFNQAIFDKILNSFVIDSNLIPEKTQPITWLKVENEFFSFKYPSNIFTEGYSGLREHNDPSEYENIVWRKVFDSNIFGSFTINIEEGSFNPNSSEIYDGEEGIKIDFEEKLFKGKTIYGYHWACGYAIKIPIKNKTISIYTASCIDSAYDLSEEDLFNEILDTFEFKQ